MKAKTNKKIQEQLCNKIRYLLRSITGSSGNYDKEHMKNKFNSDDNARTL